MSWVNETRFLAEHELRECKCGLNESVCNSKQNGTMMDVGVSAKNWMIRDRVKMIPSACDC